MSVILLSACENAVQDGANGPEISGVYIGMSEDDLIAALGEPNSKDSTSVEDLVSFEYEGISIGLRESGFQSDSPNVVDDIWANGAEHCYRKYVCPGAQLDRVRDKLGDVDFEWPKKLSYDLDGLVGCFMWIYSEDRETVSSVRFTCLV